MVLVGSDGTLKATTPLLFTLLSNQNICAVFSYLQPSTTPDASAPWQENPVTTQAQGMGGPRHQARSVVYHTLTAAAFALAWGEQLVATRLLFLLLLARTVFHGLVQHTAASARAVFKL